MPPRPKPNKPKQNFFAWKNRLVRKGTAGEKPVVLTRFGKEYSTILHGERKNPQETGLAPKKRVTTSVEWRMTRDAEARGLTPRIKRSTLIDQFREEVLADARSRREIARMSDEIQRRPKRKKP